MPELHWSAAPTSVRLLLFYLCLVLIWAFSRALRLVRRSYSLAEHLSLDDLRGGSSNPDVFAERAFANRVRCGSVAAATRELDKWRNTIGNQAALEKLQMANIKFRFILAWADIQIAEIKKLFWISALLSSFVFAFSAFPTWREFFDDSKLTALEALMEAMPGLFDWASLALATCTILYAIWAFMHGTLRRRQARWEYFYSRAYGELSNEIQKSGSAQPPPKPD